MGRPRPEHQRKEDLQSALRRRHRPDRKHGRRTPADNGSSTNASCRRCCTDANPGLTQAARKKLAVAQRRMERRMAGVRLIDRCSNDWLRGVTKIKDVTDTAARRKWSFAWKMANASADKWSTRIEAWRPPTTRPQRRPATRWTDDFAKKLGSKNWQRSARRETHSTWCNRCDNV